MRSDPPGVRWSSAIWITLIAALTLAAGCRDRMTPIRLGRNDIRNRSGLGWTTDSSTIIFRARATAEFHPIALPAGRFTLRFRAEGIPANGTAPECFIYVGPLLMRQLIITAGNNNYQVNFQLPKPVEQPLLFQFTNEYYSALGTRAILLSLPLIVEGY